MTILKRIDYHVLENNRYFYKQRLAQFSYKSPKID